MKLIPWRLLCIAVVFALGASACGSDTDLSNTDQSDPETSESSNSAAAEAVAPTLETTLELDAKSGQNLHLTMSDFIFTPENVGGADLANEGYAHVSINGAAPTRLYSDWLHLSLPPGDHEVRTVLVTNSGDEYEGSAAVAAITVPEAESSGHSHGADAIEVAGDAPEISLTVTEDAIAGWNVHAEITNFSLAPESASSEPVDGEGHMHLLVNGVKVQRLYGNWWHLADLPGGENTVTVEANANNHSPYAVNGEPVMASVTVVGTGEAMAEHGDEGEHGDALMLTIGYEGGEINGVDSRTEVALGQTVMLTVASDVAEHIHVHGYDLFADVGPSADGTLMFVADIPGVFEIEFEDSGVLITELEIR